MTEYMPFPVCSKNSDEKFFPPKITYQHRNDLFFGSEHQNDLQNEATSHDIDLIKHKKEMQTKIIQKGETKFKRTN